LKGSGIEDGLIETGVFGIKTLEQVLAGSHYERSLFGFLVVEECILNLQWKAFWLEADTSKYVEELEIIDKLKVAITQNDTNAKDLFWKVSDDPNQLKALTDDFNAFIEKRCNESEQCKYWTNFLQMLSHVKSLIRSDREGDFLLQTYAISQLLPMFTAFDGLNYMRCGTFYYETLKALPVTHPYLYDQFCQGNFVVKSHYGAFNAVAGDMKLEQTINRSSKSVGGVIGQQKSLQYVTEWQLIYHETLGIANAFREITRSDTAKDETYLQKDLRPYKINESNRCVLGLVKFFEDRNENPFNKSLHDGTLKNFVSQVKSNPDVSKKILNVLQDGALKYKEYQMSIFELKTSLIHDKITKMNIPTVDQQLSSNKASSTSSLSAKAASKKAEATMKALDIAKSKAGGWKDVMQYDVFRLLSFSGWPYSEYTSTSE